MLASFIPGPVRSLLVAAEQILIVPGLGGSDPDHWQTCWAGDNPGSEIVRQRDWDHPDRQEWVSALDAAVRKAPGPVILVAHSLGCHTLAHWAERLPGRAQHPAPVKAALLVAPPDIAYSATHGAEPIAGFGPPAARQLPFPALLAASRTDPWSSLDASRQLADAWGAVFTDLGDYGHVNTNRGHGPWPEGERLLHSLLAT